MATDTAPVNDPVRQAVQSKPGLFDFPNPVNEYAARTVAGGVLWVIDGQSQHRDEPGKHVLVQLRFHARGPPAACIPVMSERHPGCGQQ